MITKLILKNWKSHEESELEFSPGTNGLVGIVGSGKTSILDAISFGLFGTFPKLQLRKIKLEDIIMKKPVAKTSSEVEVEFVIDGNNYKVKRIIEKGRGTSYSEVTENGKVLDASGTKNVTAIVEKKLKVNYELFSKAIYSEQNAIDYFLTLGKGQRMKKIDELLMIDRFEATRVSTVKLANRFVERKLAKQSTIDQLNLVGTEQTIIELVKSISDLETEKEKLQNNVERITKEKIDMENEVIELRKVKKNFEILKRTESGLDSTIITTLEMIENIENSLSEIGKEVNASTAGVELIKYSQTIDHTYRLLKEMETNYQKMQNEFTVAKTNIEFLKNEKITQLEKEIEEKIQTKNEFEQLRDKTGENIGVQITNKKITMQKLIGDVESTRVKIIEAQEQIEKMSELEGYCPICGTALSDERKKIIIIQKRRELNELSEKIEKAKTERTVTDEEIKYLEKVAEKLEKMFREITGLDQMRTDLEKSKTLLGEYNQTNERLQKQIEELKIEIEKTKNKFENANTKKQKLEAMISQIKDYESKKQKIVKLKDERNRLKSDIIQLEDKLSSTMLEEVEQRLRELISKEKEIEMTLINADEVAKERAVRLEELQKSIGGVKKEKESIQQLENLIKDMKTLAEALKQTQHELRKEFVEAVNFTMNKLWETLYPYQDFIGIRLSIEDGDYVLQLQERTTNWVNVEGTASGGERSIACLALRISFALVLAPQLRILFLDEPTTNLDTRSVEVLSTTLREKLSEFMDQCFIITHDDAFESAVTGISYRLERDKGKDEATKVIRIN